MYRLVLYYLLFLFLISLTYSIFHILPFAPQALIFSTAILLSTCFLTNKFFEKFFKIQTNIESLYITALILTFIITPTATFNFLNIEFLFVAGFLAISSKFLLNIKGKHIFNPAAIAVIGTGFFLGRYASWWIGTPLFFPWTLLGILIVRKIRRYDMIFYFFIFSLISIFSTYFIRGNTNIVMILKNTFFDSPILFFAFVMLTEPLTAPPTSPLQSLYGGLVGVLFAPIHIGFFFTTPEIALSLGNVFSYLISPKQRLKLVLKEKIKLTDSVYDFIFTSKEKLNFKPGQYLEWTLGHQKTDSRGNRRYFTIASSPTEKDIKIGVKFNKKGSSFKKELEGMKKGEEIIVGSLAGDFTLPANLHQKIVLIAGGIGVTPFRSMIKHLTDTNEKRDMILIYNEKSLKEMVYKSIFDEAAKRLGIKVLYYETSKKGRITPRNLREIIPDFKERLFYISGSHSMVTGFKNLLKSLGIKEKQLKLDYFPGF